MTFLSHILDTLMFLVLWPRIPAGQGPFDRPPKERR